MSLSDVLKQRRKELGLTLLNVADKVGVSEATVQRWESGNIKNLRHERIGKLAEVLRVSPAFLMGWGEGTSGGEDKESLDDFQYALYNETKGVSDATKQSILAFVKYAKSLEKEENKNHTK